MCIKLTIILDESPDSRQAAQGSTRLVPVQHAELGEAKRQLSVGSLAGVKEDAMTRTVHWLHSEHVFVHFDLEDILCVMFPMA
jgi:hypothetical protein